MIEGQALPCYSIRVETPDGVMFVHIIEENGEPNLVLINVGKAGTNIAAWGDAVARLVTNLLPDHGVYRVIAELSGITSGKIRHLKRGEVCRSGPEGLAMALLKYRMLKFKEDRPKERR